jgi:hypothetical protein
LVRRHLRLSFSTRKFSFNHSIRIRICIWDGVSVGKRRLPLYPHLVVSTLLLSRLLQCSTLLWYIDIEGLQETECKRTALLLDLGHPSYWRYHSPPFMALHLARRFACSNPILCAPRRHVSDDVRNTPLLSRFASNLVYPRPFSSIGIMYQSLQLTLHATTTTTTIYPNLISSWNILPYCTRPSLNY